MGKLDVAANGSHFLGLFEKLTYAGPHFCEQSRHGFLNVERLLAERVHQILVAVAVLDQFGKQLEESRFRVIPRDQAAGFLDQILHSSDDNGLEVQLAPIRSSVHIPVATLWAHFQGGDVDKGLAELETPAKVMIDDLLWWTTALKTARKA